MNVKSKIKKLFQRIVSFFQKNTEIRIFFLFFATSLFLGDGKQPFVDVWWALGILTMFAIRYYQRGKLDLAPLPRPIGFIWIALIIYYIALISFSDSAGYSISATIKLIEGYLIYVLFTNVKRDDSGHDVGADDLFHKGIILSGFIATLASFVFLVRPDLARFLPPMNLLYANYGHNHLADLLLFVIPVVIALVEKKRSAGSIGLLAFFVVGMILTFARGAWILLVFYLLFLVVRSKRQPIKMIGLSIAAVIIAAILAISLVSLRGTIHSGGAVARTVNQVQKPSLLQDGRWEYWRQAVEAIKERPFFGSGPGTFYLESKRLQSRSSSWSWFAHSFPLESVAELGLVGAVLLMFVVVSSLRRNFGSPLFVPILLTFLYSAYEFNLNYSSIWLLLWASTGIVCGGATPAPSSGARTQDEMVRPSLFVLLLFYASSIVSVSFGILLGQKGWAFLVAPYYKQGSIGVIPTASHQVQKGIAWLNRRDPDVLYSLAQAGKKDLFKKVASLDLHNGEYHKMLIESFLERDQKVDISNQIRQLAIGIVKKEDLGLLRIIHFDAPPFLPFYSSDNREVLTAATPLGFAKLFYFLGLFVYPSDPTLTKTLWSLAKNLAPDWSYFYVELASLEQFRFKNTSGAQKLLKECAANIFSKQFCERVHTIGLPTIGSLQNKISTINKP